MRRRARRRDARCGDLFDYYLLFETEEQYLSYCGLPDDPELFDLLNMDIVERQLCSASADFPTRFIRKMNPDSAVAEFRIEVFRDLLRDSAWRDAEELCGRISALRAHADMLGNVSDPVHRRIVGVHIASQYYGLLDGLRGFVSRFRSSGFRRAGELLGAYLGGQEAASDREAIFRAEELLRSCLGVSLRIDRAKKTVTVAEAGEGISEELRDLDSLCRELTGVSVFQPFSVVDPGAPTLLEKTVVERILREHGELSDALRAAPEVEIMWEPLMLLRAQLGFYIAFIRLTEQLREKKLPFCFPVFDDSRRICASGLYDVGLSLRKIAEADFVQTRNGIELAPDIVGFILTGANQGGKTTYLRSVGEAVYLSMCGCPVPAESITLRPYRAIYALFGGEEDESNTVSRFESEIKKYYRYRGHLDESVLVLLNEYFVGTNRFDAVEILGQCIRELTDKRVTFGCVTHFQEIRGALGGELDGRILYLRAEIPSDNAPEKRYVIAPGYPDGRAYSERITERLGMTYDALVGRLEKRGVDGV